MNHNKYHDQVALLIKALPIVMEEEAFSLKGGTAINLFVRNMPRLSVDIDLTFLPVLERKDTIEQINRKMLDTAKSLENKIEGAQTKLIYTQDKICRNIRLNDNKSVIKIEINHVLRGQVRSEMTLPLCERAQDEFQTFIDIRCLHFNDLYAGKICAALSRQHPRDLFDIKLLLESEGITEELRKTFIVYLASGNRSISGMLNPMFKNIRQTFDGEFSGMNFVKVNYEDLESARSALVKNLRENMTEEEKKFLISLKSGAPEWDLLEMPNIKDLPAIKWKIQNIKKMKASQRGTSLKKLEETLSL